jgi:plasmid stability protein
MASMTIRNIDDETKRRLRLRAAANGHSLEAEVREILNSAASVTRQATAKTGLDLFRGIREVVEKYGGVELEIPPRTPMRAISLEEDAAPHRSSETKPAGRKPRKRPRR